MGSFALLSGSQRTVLCLVHQLLQIAKKAGAIVFKVNPAYTSQLLSYRDEVVFTDISIREYWDEDLNLLVDRDINAGMNIKRVGLDMFTHYKTPSR
jgi:putative transposase